MAASFAVFGRRAINSAFHCATEARYSSFPPRVAALRRSSLETVDGDRPIRRAISRTPAPCARNSAISSRSSNDRYRPDNGASMNVGIPPRSRNHRLPAAATPPTATAASSLLEPLAISRQNSRSTSRRSDGAPATSSAPDPSTPSSTQPACPSQPSSIKRCDDHLNPPNTRQFDFTQVLDDHDVLASIGTVGDAYDNAMAESFVDSFKTELIADRVWRTQSQLELAIVSYIGWFNDRRLHSALGDIPPAEPPRPITARSRYRPASSRSDSPASICCDLPAAIASRYPSGRDLTRNSRIPSSKAGAGRNSGGHGLLRHHHPSGAGELTMSPSHGLLQPLSRES